MKEIETTSTSLRTADCEPIILRVLEHVRLAFLPTLVENTGSPEACVRGRFVYQKKAKNDEWSSLSSESLASLKFGEGYQLELKSGELLRLMRELGPLYRLYRQVGIPMGKSKFVKVEASLARFFALGEDDLRDFFESHTDNAAKTLLRLVQWLAISPHGVSRLLEIAPTELPSLTTLLGLTSIKNALKNWSENQTNGSEEFWQEELAERAYVLSQAYAYPIVIIKAKAYVGGKQVSNTGGNIADFLAKVESTDAVLMIEIKTPRTKLLGPEYRDGVYPFSQDLSGAIAQALSYRRSLGLDFHNITADSPKRLMLGEPRCLVIAGNAQEELKDIAKRESFELQRERLLGVTVITYDELFLKLRRLTELLEV